MTLLHGAKESWEAAHGAHRSRDPDALADIPQMRRQRIAEFDRMIGYVRLPSAISSRSSRSLRDLVKPSSMRSGDWRLDAGRRKKPVMARLECVPPGGGFGPVSVLLGTVEAASARAALPGGGKPPHSLFPSPAGRGRRGNIGRPYVSACVLHTPGRFHRTKAGRPASPLKRRQRAASRAGAGSRRGSGVGSDRTVLGADRPVEIAEFFPGRPSAGTSKEPPISRARAALSASRLSATSALVGRRSRASLPRSEYGRVRACRPRSSIRRRRTWPVRIRPPASKPRRSRSGFSRAGGFARIGIESARLGAVPGRGRRQRLLVFRHTPVDHPRCAGPSRPGARDSLLRSGRFFGVGRLALTRGGRCSSQAARPASASCAENYSRSAVILGDRIWSVLGSRHSVIRCRPQPETPRRAPASPRYDRVPAHAIH